MQRVVFTNGVFDLIHPGHVECLKFARSQGDRLIVGVNSDASVRKIGRPINPAEDRAAVVEAIRWVDEVRVFDDLILLIERLRPDVYVKGGDYDMDSLQEAFLVRSWGGVAICSPHTGHSTTRIVERINGSGRWRFDARQILGGDG